LLSDESDNNNDASVKRVGYLSCEWPSGVLIRILR
jgi:hypothetical protein